MALQKLPTSGLDDVNQRRKRIETLNNVLDFTFDDSRIRTAAETAAGVTPVNYAYVPADALGTVGRYGAVGDWNGTTGTDDTIALRRAFLVAQAQGGGVVDLGSRRYRVYSDTGDTDPICDLSDCRGIRIKANGAEIVINRTFSGSTIFDMFRFTACNGIEIDPLKVTCTSSQTAGQRADRGVEVFKFFEGCENIDAGTCTFQDVRAGFMFRRESTDSTAFSSRRIRVAKIRAYRVGYPFSCILSGDNVEVEIVSEECTRSYYIYGVVDHTVRVRSRNHEGNADCLLSTAVGNGIDGLHLTYTNVDSTVSDNSINCVKLEYGDQTAARCADIDIHLNIRTAGSAYLGYGFIGTKLDNGGSADTTDRGHTLDGFRLSGRIVGSNANQRTIAFCGVGTWGSGEVVRDVNFKIRCDADGQAIVNCGSLEETAYFEQCFFKVTPDIDGPGTASDSYMTFIACQAPNFTTATTDTVVANYIGCRITDGTNQSLTNKSFFGCRVQGYNGAYSHVSAAGQMDVPVIATASLPAAATAMNGAVIIEDAGAGDRNLIIYGGGERFRIDGGANV